MRSELSRKYKKLKDMLAGMERVLIAYSGGVDSTFLLKAALDTLGPKRVLAVTAKSKTYPFEELRASKKTAREFGVRHIVIETRELEIPGFRDNPPTRCYACKKELFEGLRTIADEHGIRYILDATNHDDLSDFRPGMNAAKEMGIQSPLVDAGMGKGDIRKLSQRLKLNTWNKPSLACLSSRFPYGEEITEEKLGMVDRAERYLRELGFREIRVRHHHKNIARIELGKRDLERFYRERGLSEKIIRRLKRIGYLYITIDLEGYHTGSMNRVLK